MGNVFKVLTYKQIEGKCSLLSRRFTVELNNNEKEHWAVHIHYRNLRLEMTTEEFIEFADGIAESLDNIKRINETEDSRSC